MKIAQIGLPGQIGKDCDRPDSGTQPGNEVIGQRAIERGYLLAGQILQGGAHFASDSLLFLSIDGNCHLRIVWTAKTIEPIPMVKQATALLLLSCVVAFAQDEKNEGEQKFEYKPPVVEKILFDDSLSMFGQERHEYATNLAVYAANQLIAKKASAESLVSARRILALSFHLERRNKVAMVVNFQLKEGVMPEVRKGDYNPRTFSRLLLARAKLFLRRDNESEKLLAHCFVELAALIDPRNEDAVFAYENQRIDVGEIDWRVITDAAKDKPSHAPEK
jgi:hypothetical protein